MVRAFSIEVTMGTLPFVVVVRYAFAQAESLGRRAWGIRERLDQNGLVDEDGSYRSIRRMLPRP